MRDFDIPDQRRQLPSAVAMLVQLQAKPQRPVVANEPLLFNNLPVHSSQA
jgi:hypothetical protein